MTLRTLLTAGVLLLLSSASPLVAEDDVKTIGGRLVQIRVRERDRMRKEYAALQAERATKLREAREETAGSAGQGVRGWRDGSYGAIADPAPEPEPEPVRSSGGVRTIEGTPKYLLYAMVVALSSLLFVRVRRRRLAVTS